MIKEIHYFSGVTLAVFVGTHLFNHLLVLRSEALHRRFMQAARRVYRYPVVEGVLFLAVAVQISSGIALVFQKWPFAEGWFDWLHIASGLYLAAFLTNHVRAVIVGRYRLRMDTDLYYGAGVMNMWPQKLFFIPYYALAIIAFFTHAACIHRIKMQAFVPPEVAERQAVGAIVLGLIVTSILIYRMSHLRMHADLHR